MHPTNRSKSLHYEAQVQEAIQSLKDGRFSSVRAAAYHFKVSRDTLRRRMAGGNSRA